jgi:hypothetical protein
VQIYIHTMAKMICGIRSLEYQNLCSISAE